MTGLARDNGANSGGAGPWTDRDTEMLLHVKNEYLFEHNQLIAAQVRILKRHLEQCARAVATGPDGAHRPALTDEMIAALQMVDNLLDELNRRPG